MRASADPIAALVDSDTPVFVLRRSLRQFQHCALAVARSLGRIHVPVYSVRLNRREPATRSRYLKGSLPLAPDAPDEQWIERLISAGSGTKRALLLPIDDLAAVLVGDYQDRLAEHFLLPIQPVGLQRRLASKRELWELCLRLGISTPASTFPVSALELEQQAAAHGYPVVMKRAEPWLAPRDANAPSVVIAQSREDLLRAYARMESDVQPQIMLQDYVPGDSDSVWMFNGYFDASSECVCAFTGRKLRQRGPRTGPTTLGVCASNNEVADAAIKLMRELDYHGIVDMGFRFDARDGRYKLLDVNPRLGSTFRLFAADNGIDVVRAMHLDLSGRTVPAAATPDGRKWIDEPGDLATAAKLIRERTLDLSFWRRSLRGVDEAAWWAADDPFPFLGMAARAGPRGLRTLGHMREW